MSDKDYGRTIFLTQYVMEHFYQKSLSDIVPYFHQDIMWIGAEDEQFFQGCDAVRWRLTELMGPSRWILTEQKYKMVCRTADICAVAGRTVIRAAGEGGEPVFFVQRLTLIWKWEQEQPKILHMHISNPLEADRQKARHPRAAGRRTCEYMSEWSGGPLDQVDSLHFQGKNAETYFFRPDEILYIEARNISSTIHTAVDSCTVCQSLSRIEQSLPRQFLRIHRSFIINRNHTSQLNRYKIILKDGTVLPVPEKKYADVRSALLENSGG